jgi:hypothetical protein
MRLLNAVAFSEFEMANVAFVVNRKVSIESANYCSKTSAV